MPWPLHQSRNGKTDSTSKQTNGQRTEENDTTKLPQLHRLGDSIFFAGWLSEGGSCDSAAPHFLFGVGPITNSSLPPLTISECVIHARSRIFPFNFAPRGWAFCNGQLMPIAQNTALFSLLGTTDRKSVV